MIRFKIAHSGWLKSFGTDQMERDELVNHVTLVVPRIIFRVNPSSPTRVASYFVRSIENSLTNLREKALNRQFYLGGSMPDDFHNSPQSKNGSNDLLREQILKRLEQIPNEIAKLQPHPAARKVIAQAYINNLSLSETPPFVELARVLARHHPEICVAQRDPLIKACIAFIRAQLYEVHTDMILESDASFLARIRNARPALWAVIDALPEATAAKLLRSLRGLVSFVPAEVDKVDHPKLKQLNGYHHANGSTRFAAIH
jgi:Leucine-rich repeat (LRR) protein